jgi:hypothetical protein
VPCGFRLIKRADLIMEEANTGVAPRKGGRYSARGQ